MLDQPQRRIYPYGRFRDACRRDKGNGQPKLGRKLKGLYEPATWFKTDGHRFIGKPPDKQIGA